MIPRRVVCAAMLMKDGRIVTGIRHFSPEMRAIMKRVYGEEYHTQIETQGFVDQKGVFLNRVEAYKVARDAGQILRRVGGDETDGGTLYSEALY